MKEEAHSSEDTEMQQRGSRRS